MTRIEFRFAQVILSHVSGDRVTVALAHWDGSTLRTASNFDALALVGEAQRDVLRRTVEAQLKRAAKIAKADTSGRLFGLSDIVRVREGLGSSLLWAEPQTVDATKPVLHFESLRASLRLEREPHATPSHLTNKRLEGQLEDMATTLKVREPDFIRVREPVERLRPCTPALSWKNGLWHHAMPLSLDCPDAAAIRRRVSQLVGTVDLCMPKEDAPVAVAVLPTSPTLADVARTEAKIVDAALREHGGFVITVPANEGGAQLDALLTRVTDDLAGPH